MFDFYDDIVRNKRNSNIIIAIFAVIITALAYYIMQRSGYGIWSAVFSIPISLAFTFSIYWNSASIVIASVGAKKAGIENKREQNIIEELSIAAGLCKTPELYIMETEQMNAFATGRNPENAVVCLTTGIINRLERYELEAVIAHELTHIINYDIRLSAVVSAMAGIIVILGDIVFRYSMFGGKDKEEDSKANLIFGIVMIIVAILAPILTRFLELMISRKREYLADAGAVALTKNPEAMISALYKISGDDKKINVSTGATAQMFIEEPELEKRAYSGRSSWFSTHPTIEERVNAIRSLN